jgi:hypothetical protein
MTLARESSFKKKIDAVSPDDQFVEFLRMTTTMSYEAIWNSYFAEEFED